MAQLSYEPQVLCFRALYICITNELVPPSTHFAPYQGPFSFEQLQHVLLYIERKHLGALTVALVSEYLEKCHMCIIWVAESLSVGHGEMEFSCSMCM